MHVADPLMMHRGMTSVSSTSRESPLISGDAWTPWCCFAGGHVPHVCQLLGAPLCSDVHGEQEGLVPRCAGEDLQTFGIEPRWPRPSLRCLFTEEAPPTRWSAEKEEVAQLRNNVQVKGGGSRQEHDMD